MQSEIKSVIQILKNTSLSGLVSDIPLTSNTCLQHGATHIISLIKQMQPFTYHLMTTNEVSLLSLLFEVEAANAILKFYVLELQAANVLNEMYCNVLRGQLANQEEKKQKGKEKRKLEGDSFPWLLSGDEFYERVVEFECEQKKVAADMQTRKADRERRAEQLATWKQLEDQWKNQNKELKAMEKANRRRFSEKKPALGKWQGMILRPKLNICEDEDGQSASGEEFLTLMMCRMTAVKNDNKV
ncbi:hypothetical protein DEU56DRAFT_760707 [Suillus clintonianus]|uniref:uncharacterized protein n=1 Tax=Suillus clintonianus TaxID=1904413 RepID=UPI001B87E578|nr:uncharacterized protein DEU56DRAFT_760707 [Suillus clintonianus]KAG2121288.1 hypothetical protein DEU56DRAFT_760707 [Suillus clintonianus]